MRCNANTELHAPRACSDESGRRPPEDNPKTAAVCQEMAKAAM